MDSVRDGRPPGAWGGTQVLGTATRPTAWPRSVRRVRLQLVGSVLSSPAAFGDRPAVASIVPEQLPAPLLIVCQIVHEFLIPRLILVRLFRARILLHSLVFSTLRSFENNFAYFLREGECSDPEIEFYNSFEPDVRCTLWCSPHCETSGRNSQVFNVNANSDPEIDSCPALLSRNCAAPSGIFNA